MWGVSKLFNQKEDLNRSFTPIYNTFFIFLILLGCFIPGIQSALAGSGKGNLRDINYRLYRFDNQKHIYVPFLPGLNKNESNIVLPIKRYEFPGSYVSFTLPEDSHLFVNGEYFYSSMHEETKNLNLDSLFRFNEDDSLILGIYLPHKNSGKLNVAILTKGNGDLLSSESKNDNLRANHSGFRDFLIIGILLIAAYIAFLINYDRKLFGQYTNVIKIFTGPEADDLLDRNKPVAGTDLLFVILESLLLGFFVYLILMGSQQVFSEQHLFFKGIINWVIISASVLFWILIKFNLVRNLSRILMIKDIGKVHFIESSRITLFLLIGYSILSVLLLFGFKINFSSYITFLTNSLIFIAFSRFALILIKILNYAPYKKMYIISYLCASELIPVVLGLKLILDSSLATWVI